MAWTTKEILGFTSPVVIWLLKPIITKLYERWLENTPGMETFLITITFGQYHKRARKASKEAAELAAVNLHNAEVIKNNQSLTYKIDRLIAGIGYKYSFNRVTVSTYKYLGEKLPENPTLKDFENMQLSITNEWTDDNTKDVMNAFQNYPTVDFAKDLLRLHNSPDGFIVIPDPIDPDSSNLYGIVKSWRFKLGTSILDGVLVMSFTWKADFTMDSDKIGYIKMMAKRIFNIKSKYL